MMLSALWESVAQFHVQLVSLALTLLGVFVVWLFRPQVKLIYGHANNSLHNVGLPNPDPSQQPISTSIYVEKFFLQNAGRKPATDVEFVLSNFPTNVSVFQPR